MTHPGTERNPSLWAGARIFTTGPELPLCHYPNLMEMELASAHLHMRWGIPGSATFNIATATLTPAKTRDLHLTVSQAQATPLILFGSVVTQERGGPASSGSESNGRYAQKEASSSPEAEVFHIRPHRVRPPQFFVGPLSN